MSGLAVGTAQWGMLYGRTNRHGVPSDAEVQAIAAEAWAAGARWLDTAQAYGDSETRIGTLLPNTWAVTTKLHPRISTPNEVRSAVIDSLRRLRRDHVDLLLLHRVAQSEVDGVWDELLAAREEGLIAQIGVSVEAAARVPDARAWAPTLQVSASLVDQRLTRRGLFDEGCDGSGRLFVRSVLLQGVAAMPVEDVPDHLDVLRPSLSRIHVTAKEWGMSPSELLIRYARDRFGCTIVLGAESVSQMEANARAWMAEALPRAELSRLEALVDPQVQTETLMNPARWPSPGPGGTP